MGQNLDGIDKDLWLSESQALKKELENDNDISYLFEPNGAKKDFENLIALGQEIIKNRKGE